MNEFPNVTYNAIEVAGVTVVTVAHENTTTMWVRHDMSLDVQRDGLHDVVWESGVDDDDIAHVVDVIVDTLRERGHDVPRGDCTCGGNDVCLACSIRIIENRG